MLMLASLLAISTAPHVTLVARFVMHLVFRRDFRDTHLLTPLRQLFTAWGK